MISLKGFSYPKEIILQTVRWYVTYNLSYRDLEAMLLERGTDVDHSMINRWVLRFAHLNFNLLLKSKMLDPTPFFGRESYRLSPCT